MHRRATWKNATSVAISGLKSSILTWHQGAWSDIGSCYIPQSSTTTGISLHVWQKVAYWWSRNDSLKEKYTVLSKNQLQSWKTRLCGDRDWTNALSETKQISDKQVCYFWDASPLHSHALTRSRPHPSLFKWGSWSFISLEMCWSFETHAGIPGEHLVQPEFQEGGAACQTPCPIAARHI